MKQIVAGLVSCLAVLAIALVVPQPAFAVTYVRMADADLAAQATVVAEVRVLSEGPAPGTAWVATDYSVEIVDLIAGYVPGGQIVVNVPGGPDLSVPGAPHFEEGETALLFLASRADGSYGILHLMLGAFYLAEHDGQRLAYRELSEATEIELPGRSLVEPEQLRDLDRFRAWLEDHARGSARSADYWVETPEGFVPGTHEKYTLLGPGRWTQFDSGGSVEWRAHSSGQPGQPGGGFTDFRRGLAVWTNHPTTPIRYLYGGTTTATGGMTSGDGINAILFDDPNDRIEGTFACSEGGVVGIGGFRTNGQTSRHNNFNFGVIVEGDIVTNDGIECLLPGRKLAEELFGHELGHTLGVGHSSSRSALMWAFIRNDGRGARLSDDDKNAITFIYGDPPAAPSELAAESRDDGILLTWRDNSNDETKFELERSVGGSFTRVSLPDANDTSWLDTGASGGVTYTYRIRGANAAGRSDYSNEASATAPGVAAPGNFTAIARSASEIELVWQDRTEDETEFQIEGKTGAEPFALVATVPADTERVTLDSLMSETTYAFRARAFGPQGFSPYSAVASATTFGAPCECVEGPTTMCLDGGRFRVQATWRNMDGDVGDGQIEEFGSNDSGLLWFFDPTNWEMLIKVLDGCGINDRFWVFAAATTDVEYNLEVTDCWTGGTASYFNPLNTASPAITDAEAFATCSAIPPTGFVPQDSSLDLSKSEVSGASSLEKTGGCVPSATDLCLVDNRFQVEIEWENMDGVTGDGQVVVTESPNSGILWFFSADNWEMLVKVLNGCNINDRWWLFAAATTDVKYQLRVTDTTTGDVAVYNNAQGNAADAITDTSAFDTCP